jgi:hypothetical protein
MKKLILLITIFTFFTNAFATAQAPDVLFYDNKVYDLYSNPLESFYKNEKERPKFSIAPGVMSSGNWRGYVAYWEIAEDALYLKAIDSWVCGGRPIDPALEKADCKKADVKKLFGNKLGQGKIFADWFTGELRIPDGEQLQYVHMGYGSIYERDILISVKEGRIVEKKIVDNTEKKSENELELQRKELEKLKKSPIGSKKIS